MTTHPVAAATFAPLVPLATLDTFLASHASQRVQRLGALLGIYGLGLALVLLLQDGADIGAVLAALFAHAVYVAGRTIARRDREQTLARVVGERRDRFARVLAATPG